MADIIGIGKYVSPSLADVSDEKLSAMTNRLFDKLCEPADRWTDFWTIVTAHSICRKEQERRKTSGRSHDVGGTPRGGTPDAY